MAYPRRPRWRRISWTRSFPGWSGSSSSMTAPWKTSPARNFCITSAPVPSATGIMPHCVTSDSIMERTPGCETAMMRVLSLENGVGLERLRPGRFLQRNGDLEGRAAPVFALHPDVAAHHLRELAADGEAKSRPPILAGGRGIDLRKTTGRACRSCRPESRCRYRGPKRERRTRPPHFRRAVTEMLTSPFDVKRTAFARGD